MLFGEAYMTSNFRIPSPLLDYKLAAMYPWVDSDPNTNEYQWYLLRLKAIVWKFWETQYLGALRPVQACIPLPLPEYEQKRGGIIILPQNVKCWSSKWKLITNVRQFVTKLLQTKKTEGFCVLEISRSQLLTVCYALVPYRYFSETPTCFKREIDANLLPLIPYVCVSFSRIAKRKRNTSLYILFW